MTESGPRLTIQSYSLFSLILYAYDVKRYQLATPTPLAQTTYDIVAKAEGDGTRNVAEFRSLMRELLQERFRLAVHWETRSTPVYALIVGKSGPKLRQSAPDAEFRRQTTLEGPNFQTRFSKTGTEYLASHIGDNAGLERPVVNFTGLTGTYDFQLTYTPEYRLRDMPATTTDAIQIFAAVQELGLALERRVAPVEFLVIDHAERPSPN